MSRLNGKVALVSGGARGIGAAVARAMVAEDAKVVIGDLLDAEGQALAKELGPAATYVNLNVVKPTDWQRAVGHGRYLRQTQRAHEQCRYRRQKACAREQS